MKSLTGLDATFLYLETPEMPMHVGSLNLCELPAGFKGSFHKAVKTHIGKRMHLAPVFSRKLVFMPLDLGHPLWVEADSVDIDFHIRRADPAKKGAATMTLAEVHKLCAQLHGEVIDRDYPLWEFYIFDRIQLPESQGGGIVAGFFSKIHHAALDGKGGVMLANAMLDLSPTPREVAPPDPERRRKLESDLKLGKMIGSVFSSSLGQLAKVAKSLPAAASTFGSTLAKQSMGSSATGVKAKMPMKLAPPTPFNAGITTGRVFVTATIPLAETKAMGKAVGGSFNDMVLWICSTALRNYLTQHHSLPKKSLVAAMPVSLREAGATDASNLGNQVSMSLVELGTHLAHPLKRMNAIMASTAKVKTSDAKPQGPAADRLPFAAGALAGGRRRQNGAQCLWQERHGQPAAHGRQPGDFQRAGPARAAVPGRREVPDLPPAVHHPARPGAQHHHPDLRRPCGFRHHCRQEGAAARQGPGEGD
jgi:diacylglycerol O-acyltransferase